MEIKVGSSNLGCVDEFALSKITFHENHNLYMECLSSVDCQCLAYLLATPSPPPTPPNQFPHIGLAILFMLVLYLFSYSCLFNIFVLLYLYALIYFS
jgi:hypothetical protein